MIYKKTGISEAEVWEPFFTSINSELINQWDADQNAFFQVAADTCNFSEGK